MGLWFAREFGYPPPMTPGEKNIVKSLVAVAWADGKVEQPEEDVIEGLLAGFDASEDEEQEIREYAKEKRTLDKDIPLGELSKEDRELLLANAALLTHADGEQSDSEKALLDKLVTLLEIDATEAEEILDSVKDGALRLGSNVLEDVK
jgi:tellurite resistance protein